MRQRLKSILLTLAASLARAIAVSLEGALKKGAAMPDQEQETQKESTVSQESATSSPTDPTDGKATSSVTPATPAPVPVTPQFKAGKDL